MSIHIVVDGYNLIRQSSRLSNIDKQGLQLGRDALIDALIVYKNIKGHEITVVFDGIDMPFGYCQRDKKEGVEIRFSKSGETADEVINQMLIKEKHKILVVSCDHEVIGFARAAGASAISSIAFEKKIEMASHLSEKTIRVEDYYRKYKTTTCKKGPSKRLPKNKRKHQIRISKL